jgi:hypothetical protein
MIGTARHWPVLTGTDITPPYLLESMRSDQVTAPHSVAPAV